MINFCFLSLTLSKKTKDSLTLFSRLVIYSYKLAESQLTFTIPHKKYRSIFNYNVCKLAALYNVFFKY